MHARNHKLSAAAEIFANGTYFPIIYMICDEPKIIGYKINVYINNQLLGYEYL
jgi:hypothetical protein